MVHRYFHPSSFFSVLVACLALCSETALSQWSSDPTANTPVCVNPVSNKTLPSIVSDGRGGSIICWVDYSVTGYTKCQRLDSAGHTRWDSNGVSLNGTQSSQPTFPNKLYVDSDSNNGAYVHWRGPGGHTLAGLYANRIDSNGHVESNNVLGTPFSGEVDFAVNSRGELGQALCFNLPSQPQYLLASTYWNFFRDYSIGSACVEFDNSDDLVLMWIEYPPSGFSVVRGQRVNSAHATFWTDSGTVIVDTIGGPSAPHIVSVGSNKIILTWIDTRNGLQNIFVQKVDSTGKRLWQRQGIPIFSSDSLIDHLSIMSDGLGGAILLWQGVTNSTNQGIFVQRVDQNGIPKWGTNGLAICTLPGIQGSPCMISDGYGGAIITWHDYRSGNDADVYAQRVTVQGAPLWDTNGEIVSNATRDQLNPAITADGLGGAIITWQDYRNQRWDIYAQHVNPNGAVPVQLANFNAMALGTGSVALSWRTISETNNFGFEVQRKSLMQPDFATIPNSFIAGHGTSLEPHDYSFTDTYAFSEQTQYRLKQIDLDGSEHFSEPVSISNVMNAPTGKQIAEFRLHQNYPNPFNPETNIRFSVENPGRTTLQVYNLLGELVASLFDESVPAGFSTTVRFNGANLASGIYVYRLQNGTASQIKKFLLVR